MKVSDKSNIIIADIKVIGKQNQLKVVHSKMDNLQKKKNVFKSKFKDLFKMGLPSFWDANGLLIS